MRQCRTHQRGIDAAGCGDRDFPEGSRPCSDRLDRTLAQSRRGIAEGRDIAIGEEPFRPPELKDVHTVTCRDSECAGRHLRNAAQAGSAVTKFGSQQMIEEIGIAWNRIQKRWIGSKEMMPGCARMKDRNEAGRIDHDRKGWSRIVPQQRDIGSPIFACQNAGVVVCRSRSVNRPDHIVPWRFRKHGAESQRGSGKSADRRFR